MIEVRCALPVAMALVSVVPAAWGDDGSGWRPEVNGSVRGGYFTSSANLDGRRDIGSGSLWLKSTPDFGENLGMVVEGWVRNDDSMRSDGWQGRLREGYLNFRSGDTDLRIGKQIVMWGRADRLNPTDNLTPRNYTLLVPLEDDQRIGAPAVKITRHFGDTSLTGVWLPRFTPNTVPMAQPPGGYLSQDVPQGGQGAIKLDQSGGDVEWSLSYYNGFDLNPDSRIGGFGPSGMNLVLTHNRIRVLGADAATVVGRYGLRAEAAYTWTENAGADDYLIKKPQFYLVAGGDRTFFENLNVNVQYYFRQVSGYRDPRAIPDPLLRAVAVEGAVASHQIDRLDHGLTMRIADKWLNETLEGEVAGVYSARRGDYAVKARLVYAFSDAWKGTLGTDFYRGPDDTFFGRLRNISSVFAEIKYSF